MRQELKKASVIFVVIFAVQLQHERLSSQPLLGYEFILETPWIDDVVIDRSNRIITVDASHLRIYKSSGTLLREIQLPEEHSSKFRDRYSKRMLALDMNGNIYCLTLTLEYFVSITRFDTSGNLTNRIEANGEMPNMNERIIRFYISSSNKMYLKTFPHGKTRTETNPVYVYDLNGNKVGNLDYHIEDNRGNVYRLDVSQKEGTLLVGYRQTQTKPSTNLPKLSEKRIKGNIFIGVDDSNNLYFAAGDVIEKFNVNLQEVHMLRTPVRDLEQHGIYSPPLNFRVGATGTIYLFGLHRELSEEKEGGYAKVSSVLMRLKE